MPGCQKDENCPSVLLITESNCSNPLIDPRDGQSYCTVTIGNQIWTSENMRYDTPSSIENGKDATPNYCNIEYCNWGTTNTLNDYRPIYGRYYNREAAQHACPPGWHLPSDTEWKTLEMHLGMSSTDTDRIYWRGDRDSLAKSLKSTQYWTNWPDDDLTPGIPSGNGTNATGFNAYPSGSLDLRPKDKIAMTYLGTYSFYWSSGLGFPRTLTFSFDGIGRMGSSFPLYSCRCIKN
jgi:uncharacterized protein (TIGR02145 family)